MVYQWSAFSRTYFIHHVRYVLILIIGRKLQTRLCVPQYLAWLSFDSKTTQRNEAWFIHWYLWTCRISKAPCYASIYGLRCMWVRACIYENLFAYSVKCQYLFSEVCFSQIIYFKSLLTYFHLLLPIKINLEHIFHLLHPIMWPFLLFISSNMPRSISTTHNLSGYIFIFIYLYLHLLHTYFRFSVRVYIFRFIFGNTIFIFIFIFNVLYISN